MENQQALTTGLKREGLLSNREYIDGELLEQAVAKKNILFSETGDFDNMPGYDSSLYTFRYEGISASGKTL